MSITILRFTELVQFADDNSKIFCKNFGNRAEDTELIYLGVDNPLYKLNVYNIYYFSRICVKLSYERRVSAKCVLLPATTNITV